MADCFWTDLVGCTQECAVTPGLLNLATANCVWSDSGDTLSTCGDPTVPMDGYGDLNTLTVDASGTWSNDNKTLIVQGIPCCIIHREALPPPCAPANDFPGLDIQFIFAGRPPGWVDITGNGTISFTLKDATGGVIAQGGRANLFTGLVDGTDGTLRAHGDYVNGYSTFPATDYQVATIDVTLTTNASIAAAAELASVIVTVEGGAPV